MSRAEGFVGQRLQVLPYTVQRAALRRPGTRQLLVTACGVYPRAAGHGFTRDAGTPETVLLICSAGRGWVSAGGDLSPISSGQAVLLPPGPPHAYGADPTDPWTIWWLHLAGSAVPDLLAAARVSTAARVLMVGDIRQTVGLIDTIIDRTERDSTEHSLLGAAGAAWHVVALLAADHGRQSVKDSPIEAAVTYLRDHVAASVSVAALARRAGLSPSHFAARFRQEVGTTVGAFRTDLRMAAARHLLDTTTTPVADIAAAVGYPDAFYFSRRFRAVHGCTATAYRQQSKG
ncbi:AraC-type DNA-binding protein [Nakamurella panacisegetis]|uniref:AraC-type DNA-binding protein n=1 Tax=Nakamurella panacisegetis TaxID=1090615 RepID=A0A1H0LFZ3_9ACTN|nr:helix-turn-helix domain-containing protein [Nakamurella panacisegetis]SDO67138.1 AraC-type DNA-binding protein [Nakamurella panacisegetis]